MFPDINTELFNFFVSILTGVCAVLAYTAGKSLENVIKNRSVCDMLKWILTAAVSIGLWNRLLFCRMRWYVALGMALGAVLCYFMLYKPVYVAFSFSVKKIYSFFNIILKILLTIPKFLCKILNIYTKSNGKICGKAGVMDEKTEIQD